MAKDKPRRKPVVRHNNQANFFGMLLGMWSASVNRGQLPILFFWIAFIIGIIRMPSEKLAPLYDKFLDLLERFHLLGWALWIITIIVWVYLSKNSRKTHSDEMGRVAKEKKNAQEKALGRKLPTSDKWQAQQEQEEKE